MDKSRVEALLGDKFFQGLRDFYREIRESSCAYKVCLVRRSYVLGEIFFNIVEKAQTGCANPCITDSALISLCPQIADFFMREERFPDILIADDILIHGRAVNAFLVRLEDELIHLLRERGCGLEDDWIRTKLGYALTVSIFMKNAGPTMLLLRYLTSVKCARVEKKAVWRNLSNRISLLISESAAANANYVLSSLFLQTKCKEVDTFQMVCTFYRGVRQTAYIRVLDFGDGPKAVLTVRAFDSRKEERTRMIPFVFLPQISVKAKDILLARIDERLGAAGFTGFSVRQWRGMHRISSEFISMVLSQNTLFLFLQRNEAARRNILEEEAEISKIARNYGNSKEIYHLIRFVKEHPLFGEQELAGLIAEAVSDAERLFHSDAGMIPKERQKVLLEVMEQIIYEEGMQAEREAYVLSKSAYRHTSLLYREAKLQTGTFFGETARRAQGDFSIYYAAAYTLQLMDAGIMVLSVYQSYQEDTQAYCQYCKAGEQSLMIGPLNLYKYLPLLEAVSLKCNATGKDLEKELRGYCLANSLPQEDCERMLAFMDDLKKTGQTINDWSFSMLGRVQKEYDPEIEENPYARILKNFEIADEQKMYVKNYYER